MLCRLTETPPQQLAACWFSLSLNLTEWAVTLQANAEIKGTKGLKCCTNSKTHYHIHTSNQMTPTTSTKFVCNWFDRAAQRCKKRRKQRSYLLLVCTHTHHHLPGDHNPPISGEAPDASCQRGDSTCCGSNTGATLKGKLMSEGWLTGHGLWLCIPVIEIN